jgi:hypothetical protein
MIDDEDVPHRIAGDSAGPRSLSTVIPGWNLQLIPEAVESVRRGHAIETRRLKGSRFIVVVMTSDFAIDRFLDDVHLCGGFESREAAIESARIEHRKHVAAGFAAHADDPDPWQQMRVECSDRLPTSPEAAPSLIAVTTETIGDDYKLPASLEVCTLVLPVNQKNPLDWSFVAAINKDWDLVRYFESIPPAGTDSPCDSQNSFA